MHAVARVQPCVRLIDAGSIQGQPGAHRDAVPQQAERRHARRASRVVHPPLCSLRDEVGDSQADPGRQRLGADRGLLQRLPVRGPRVLQVVLGMLQDPLNEPRRLPLHSALAPEHNGIASHRQAHLQR